VIQKKNIAVIFFLLSLLNCRNSNFYAKEGIKNLHDGKKITALKFFEEALDSNKKNPLALYGKGKIMLESSLTMTLGQKLVENSLEKLDAEYLSDAYISLAKSFAMTNLYDKAIEILEKGLEKNSSSPDIYRDLAFYYSQTLNYNKAKSVLSKGVEMFPEDADLSLELSNLYIKQFGNWNLGIEIIENSKKKNNNNRELLVKLASLYYRIGNKKLAIENLILLRNLQANENEKKQIDEWIQQAQAGKWQSGKI
jgi:tetratricopeptide (TPR) repeat protein